MKMKENLLCDDCGKIVGTVEEKVITDRMHRGQICGQCDIVRQMSGTSTQYETDDEVRAFVRFLEEVSFASDPDKAAEIQKSIVYLKEKITRERGITF